MLDPSINIGSVLTPARSSGRVRVSIFLAKRVVKTGDYESYQANREQQSEALAERFQYVFVLGAHAASGNCRTSCASRLAAISQ